MIKHIIIDCSKPIGHPDREKVQELPKSDVAWVKFLEAEAKAELEKTQGLE